MWRIVEDKNTGNVEDGVTHTYSCIHALNCTTYPLWRTLHDAGLLHSNSLVLPHQACLIPCERALLLNTGTLSCPKISQ